MFYIPLSRAFLPNPILKAEISAHKAPIRSYLQYNFPECASILGGHKRHVFIGA